MAGSPGEGEAGYENKLVMVLIAEEALRSAILWVLRLEGIASITTDHDDIVPFAVRAIVTDSALETMAMGTKRRLGTTAPLIVLGGGSELSGTINLPLPIQVSDLLELIARSG